MRDTTYSDPKGMITSTSYRENKYIMVFVELDPSAILVEPLKN